MCTYVAVPVFSELFQFWFVGMKDHPDHSIGKQSIQFTYLTKDPHLVDTSLANPIWILTLLHLVVSEIVFNLSSLVSLGLISFLSDSKALRVFEGGVFYFCFLIALQYSYHSCS